MQLWILEYMYLFKLKFLSFLDIWLGVGLLGEGNGTPVQYSCLTNPMDRGAWCTAVHGITKSQTWLSDFTFTFHFHALEKEMATHSSVLAWRIPGTAEPGGLLSMGSHRVGHDWSDLAAAEHKNKNTVPLSCLLAFLSCVKSFKLSAFQCTYILMVGTGLEDLYCLTVLWFSPVKQF